MTRRRATRRRFLIGCSAIAGVGLAGCTGGDESTATDSTPSPTDDGDAEPTTTTDEPTATDTETATPDQTTVETLVSVGGDRVPENMALGPDGGLYFGITAGEVRRVPETETGATDLTLDDTEQIATLPGAIGVETAPDGTVYVAVATQDDQAGVWEVPADGEATQLVGISGFPNDIHYDTDREHLLVTESQNGVVYAVTTDGERSTWLDDDRLDTESFGANGITRDADGDIYVAVTRAPENTGRLLRVPVESDGAAGEPSMFFEGEAIFGADGITSRDGDIYVAANSQNRVVRVTADGTTDTVATADDGLVFPSDVLFGTGDQRESLFICNFANQSPEDGAILRTSVPR
ncbi:SMP-30/gluconolactonase/LRE family protein [Haloarcula argentinensis]|uniref:SMP-30/gluconolactonase/LRE family protein n=1 Tax=Haloarcula argentinensis TaxID=43776 RepID=A0ABU2EZV7_HALAR|nr:SMP-30/gluconolactonase/LRE family protein [Haloarcula argentinensis]MDS0253346.1 SMP-30/gluconolactonase/LRE family protein [Haloarcula argentinensis]